MYDKLKEYYNNGYIYALKREQLDELEVITGYNKSIISSLWKLIVIQKSYSSSLENILTKLLEEVIESKNMFAILSKYKIQPHFLKKHLSYKRKKIYDLNKDQVDLFSKKYFTKKYGYKEKYDLFSAYHSDKSRRKGELFEKKVIKSIKKYISDDFKTEEQQKLSKSGNPTPDLLFEKRITFQNYKDISWIELKSYPGFRESINTYGVGKQVLRYVKTFDKGILLMHYGYTNEFKNYIEKKSQGKVIVLAML